MLWDLNIAQFVSFFSELKCIIVNVEFRLAPDSKFPAMFEDGKSVTRWVLMNKPLIGEHFNTLLNIK